MSKARKGCKKHTQMFIWTKLKRQIHWQNSVMISNRFEMSLEILAINKIQPRMEFVVPCARNLVQTNLELFIRTLPHVWHPNTKIYEMERDTNEHTEKSKRKSITRCVCYEVVERCVSVISRWTTLVHMCSAYVRRPADSSKNRQNMMSATTGSNVISEQNYRTIGRSRKITVQKLKQSIQASWIALLTMGRPAVVSMHSQRAWIAVVCTHLSCFMYLYLIASMLDSVLCPQSTNVCVCHFSMFSCLLLLSTCVALACAHFLVFLPHGA